MFEILVVMKCTFNTKQTQLMLVVQPSFFADRLFFAFFLKIAITLGINLVPWQKICAQSKVIYPVSEGLHFSPKLQFSGKIINESQYTSFNWEGQNAPKMYSRIYFYPEISIGIIPLTGRFNLSTEPLSSYYPGYNRFSLKFDSRKYNKLLEEEIIRKAKEKSKILVETNPIINQTKDSIEKYERLSNELNSETYLKKIEEQKHLLSDTLNMDSFALSQNKLSIGQAKNAIEKYNNALKYFEKYNKWKEKLDELDSLEITNLINQDSVEESYRKSIPDLYKIASKIQDFQIGVCYPVVSSFTMMGTPINGGYAKINSGNLTAAIGFGTRLPKFNSYLYSTPQYPNNNLFITSIGFRKENSQVLFHILKTHTGIFNLPQSDNPDINNTVASFEYKYFIPAGSIEAEVARSSYTDMQNTEGVNQNEKLFSNNDLKHHAVNLKGEFYLSTKTTFQLQSRYVGSEFRSEGTPYLRRDVAGINAKLKQFLWKKYFYIQASFGTESMNLSKFNDTRGGWNSTMLQFGLTVPGYPIITGGYMPTKQFHEYIESDSSVYSSMDLKFVQLSYNFELKNIPINVMAYYSDSRSSTIHYSFLNRNVMVDISAPISKKVLLHSSYMLSTITYYDKPIEYSNILFDLTLKKAKLIYCSGLQYRESDIFEISSVFGSVSVPTLLKGLESSVKIEALNIKRKYEHNTNKTNNSFEAGASAILMYSF